MPAPPYDEMHAATGEVREHYRTFASWLERTPQDRVAQKRAEADSLFHRVGITFAVYGEEAGTERLIPFDIVPRIIPAKEWELLAAGLKQRVRALNAFIADIYHAQNILQAGRIPAEQVLCNGQYRPEMQGIDVPGSIYAHIAGIDVVRPAWRSIRRGRATATRPRAGPAWPRRTSRASPHSSRRSTTRCHRPRSKNS